MFTRILVPTDFSGCSDAALEHARALATRFDGSLHLLHVIEDQQLSGPLGSEMYAPQPGTLSLLLKDAHTRLSHRITPGERAARRATGEVVIGSGARTIVEYAADNRFDLIVMGTHGRTGLAHVLMGSVAERVVRTAECPVLTVREAPRPAAAPGAEARTAVSA
jgi:nucleotide-binding universal stress UspA family protein